MERKRYYEWCVCPNGLIVGTASENPRSSDFSLRLRPGSLSFFLSKVMDGRRLHAEQSNGRNVISTSAIHKWSASRISGPQFAARSTSHVHTHDSGMSPMMMMSHFGHEAIFTLDYTINENQTFDCLMPGTKGHRHHHFHWPHPHTVQKVLQFC